jgi:hypothetical protein
MTEEKKAPKTIPVTVISQQGSVILVEYQEDNLPARVLLPVTALLPGSCVAETLLLAGVPASVRWHEIIHISASDRRLAECLYAAGLYTAEDVLANPKAATGALQAALSVDVAALFTAAEKLKKGR